MENYPRSKNRTIFFIVFLTLAAICATAMTLSYFTDRTNQTVSIFTSSFDADGYTISLESTEGYRTAGEIVEISIKESNNKAENIASDVSMLVTWDSPVADTYPWGSDSNIDVQMDDEDLTCTVNEDNTLSIALPKHLLSSGASETARKLTFQIPSDTDSTGSLHFSINRVELSQDPHGWSAHYDNTDLSSLAFDVGVVWNISQNSLNNISGQTNMDVIAFLTEGSGADKFGLSILKNGSASNTNGGAMQDWTNSGQSPWANYTITSLFLADGVTTIGAHAFDSTDLSGEITIPASVEEIGKLAFGNLPNVTTFTFKHDASSSVAFSDNKTEDNEAKGAFYAGSSYTETDPLNTKVNTSNKDVLNYAWGKDARGYTVTVTDVTGVTVNADPATAVNGQTISLDVLPDMGYEYKGAILSWPDGSKSLAADDLSFTMPAANTIITASAELSVQYISTVPSQSASLTYTGGEQSPSWGSFDDTQLTIGGTTSATNAGTYTATFIPKDGYAWNDGTTTAKSVNWTIGKATISTVPSQSGTLTYTGSAQSPSWNNYSSSKLTIGGTTTSTNAGSQTATFIPKANYQWSDGSTSAKSVTWTIEKAGPNLTVSAPSVSMETGLQRDVKFSYSSTGTFSASSNKTSVATIVVNDSYIQITGVATGTATVTLSVAETTNYKAASKTISISVTNPTPATLAASDFWYMGSSNITTIDRIDILDTYTPTGTVTESWNADVGNVGKIKCYVEGTKLTIAGNGTGKIIANSDSSDLFGTGYNGLFSTVTEINGLPLLDTSNVTNMERMFSGCSSLTSIDISNFVTDKVTDMSGMFQLCNSLTSLDTSVLVTDNVTDMHYMFNGLESLTSLDVSNINTENVTNMNGMFDGCSALTSLDVSGFVTDKVDRMASMFNNCTSLTSLDVSNFNTENVTTMRAMFSHCEGLDTLDLSNFVTNKVTDMGHMFSGCFASDINLTSFNTSALTNISYMFWNCRYERSLDLSSFDFTNVTEYDSNTFNYVFGTITVKDAATKSFIVDTVGVAYANVVVK